MAGPEAIIEKYLCDQIKSLGGMTIKMEGTRGVPDRLVILEGDTFMVEVKQKGGKLDDHQQRYIDKLYEHGCDTYIVWCKGDVDDLVYELKRVEIDMQLLIPRTGSLH